MIFLRVCWATSTFNIDSRERCGRGWNAKIFPSFMTYNGQLGETIHPRLGISIGDASRTGMIYPPNGWRLGSFIRSTPYPIPPVDRVTFPMIPIVLLMSPTFANTHSNDYVPCFLWSHLTTRCDKANRVIDPKPQTPVRFLPGTSGSKWFPFFSHKILYIV